VRYEEYLPLGLVTDLRFGNELGRCFHGWNDLKWLTNFGEFPLYSLGDVIIKLL
jgi:hypothetical protein